MTDATDATIFDTESLHDARQRLRRERQARVGILRNPNQPPKPPMRRASLTGRWVNMRSSRRPVADTQADQGQVATVTSPVSVTSPRHASQPLRTESAVRTSEDGRVLSVDIVGLMASVDDHVDPRTADSRTIRTPFAAQFRTDVTPQRRRTDPGYRQQDRPSILSAEAWLDDYEDDRMQPDAERTSRDPAATPREHSRWRGLVRLVASMLGGMLLAVLILLALLGPPP